MAIASYEVLSAAQAAQATQATHKRAAGPQTTASRQPPAAAAAAAMLQMPSLAMDAFLMKQGGGASFVDASPIPRAVDHPHYSSTGPHEQGTHSMAHTHSTPIHYRKGVSISPACSLPASANNSRSRSTSRSHTSAVLELRQAQELWDSRDSRDSTRAGSRVNSSRAGSSRAASATTVASPGLVQTTQAMRLNGLRAQRQRLCTCYGHRPLRVTGTAHPSPLRREAPGVTRGL